MPDTTGVPGRSGRPGRREGRPMMTCGACGATGLVEGARFCHECGAPTALQCGTCGEALLAGARFCSSCGAPSGAGPAVLPAVPESRPVAERRVTSVLFGDLVGF